MTPPAALLPVPGGSAGRTAGENEAPKRWQQGAQRGILRTGHAAIPLVHLPVQPVG